MADAFTVDGQQYRVGMMEPMVQLLVLKRLMRFVPALTASEKVLSRLKAGEPVHPEDVLDTVTALAPLVAETPDVDLNFICDACMKITRHVVAGKAYLVQTEDGVVANHDNKMPLRKLKIVGNVLGIVLAPMLAEIAPTIGTAVDAEGVA